MRMKRRGLTGPGSAGLQAGSPGGVHAGSMLWRGPEAPATAGLEAGATFSMECLRAELENSQVPARMNCWWRSVEEWRRQQPG
jgi:hypothetical protein